MKRAVVIGCPGSGKSVFSRELAAKTGLPLCHLDLLFWNPDRTTVEREEFLQRLSAVLGSDSWIIDGNYASTMELRIAKADTVFFLDYPLEICLRGIRERQGKPRPDMPWVEKKGESDPEFLGFIRNYEREQRPLVLELLQRYSHKEIHVFTSRDDASEYLKTLRENAE